MSEEMIEKLENEIRDIIQEHIDTIWGEGIKEEQLNDIRDRWTDKDIYLILRDVEDNLVNLLKGKFIEKSKVEKAIKNLVDRALDIEVIKDFPL